MSTYLKQLEDVCSKLPCPVCGKPHRVTLIPMKETIIIRYPDDACDVFKTQMCNFIHKKLGENGIKLNITL